MKDKWIDDLHDQLDRFEMDAPDGLWENIILEEKLRQQSVASGVAWRRWGALAAAAVACVAVMTVGFLFRSSRDIHNDFDSVSSMAFQDAYQESADIDIENNTPSSIASSSTWSPVAKVRDISSSSALPSITCSPRALELIPSTVLNVHHDDVVDTATDSMTTSSVVRRPERHVSGLSKRTPSISTTSPSRLSFAVYSAGLTDYSSTNKAVNNKYAAADAATWSSSWEDSPALGILTFNQGRIITTDIKHRLPFRTGLSVAYTLNQRLALVAGLSYANLKSDTRSGTDSHYFDGVQTLHYLGIPLSLKIDILRWRRFQLYSSAGLLTEKCISGKTVTNYVLNNNTREKQVYGIDQHPFQFSVNASAGLQFNISDIIALYGEPGVSYFFKDSSSLRTIYKDRPLNFNLNLGLRFTISR